MLEKIKFSYREASEQVGLFTPYHTLFKCKIKVDGLQYTFNYQCNTDSSVPNLASCLDCILMDAFAYDNSRDFDDFYNEFGTDYKAYKACKKTSKAIHRLFSDEEIETLLAEIEGEWS